MKYENYICTCLREIINRLNNNNDNLVIILFIF